MWLASSGQESRARKGRLSNFLYPWRQVFGEFKNFGPVGEYTWVEAGAVEVLSRIHLMKWERASNRKLIKRRGPDVNQYARIEYS